MEKATVVKERSDEDVWRLIGELESVTERLKEAVEKATAETRWLSDDDKEEHGAE